MSNNGCLNVEELHRLLHTILHTTDNNERRRAESIIVNSLTTTETLMHLVHILQNIQDVTPGVRQLSAVLLRKKIFSLWHAIPSESRVELKRILLSQLGFEPARHVRLALAHLVARLAKADTLELESGGWPELHQSIQSAVMDTRTELRELAMVLAYSIAEVLGESKGASLQVGEAVLQCMNDKEDNVQRAAVKAAGALLPFVAERKQEREQLLQHLVPRCLEVLTQYASIQSKVTVCVAVLDLLEQVIEELSVKKHDNLLRTLIHNVLAIFTNKTNQPRVRDSSSELLVSFINLKPKFVSKGLLEPIVIACLQVMGEDGTISLPEVAHVDEDSLNDDEDEEEDIEMLHVNPPCMYAGRLLSTLATRVSAKSFTNALLPFISQVLESPNASPLERKASILSLACLAEGNPGYLRRRVQYVLRLTHDFLHDPNPVPREAAAFALTYFCLNLQPEIVTHHQKLFPMIVPLLRDDTDGVRRRIAVALDTLCENMAEDVEPYIPVVLPVVLEAIGRSSLETQKELCGVISSLAMARCPSFQTHATHCLELLKTPLTMKTPETMLLRAKATEAVGIIANAIGKEAFLPYLPFFMDCVVDNLRTRQAELREESFGFLSNLCETLREDFIPYLNDTISCALQTINEDRARYSNKHLLAEGGMNNLNLDIKQKNKNNKEEEEDEDEDEDEDESGSEAEEIHARVRTADLEEKSSAVYCIGVCAEVLLAKFETTWIDVCWETLIDLDAHFHSGIRCSTLTALAKIAKAAHGSETVIKSISEDTLSPKARNLLNILVNDILIPCIQQEKDKEAVAAACDAFELMFNFFGPQVLSTNIDEFLQTVIALLKQSIGFQNDEDEDDEEDFDNAITNNNNSSSSHHENNGVLLNEDHDSVLMGAVCDMIESFAKAYGPSFKPYGDLILPFLLPYTADDRPSEDIVLATASIATIMEALGPASESYLEHSIHLALHLIEITDESSVKANCSYLIRVFIENCPHKFTTTDTTAPLLQALWGIASSQEEIPAAVDNAVSATCSMVRCLPSSIIPLLSVIPALLERLPMQVDRTENINAIHTLIYLMTVQQEFSKINFCEVLVRCIATVLASLTVDEEQKRRLVTEGVSLFIESCRQQWIEISSQLTPELHGALERYGCC